MGNRKTKYAEKQRKQRQNARENKAYYQTDNNWKTPSSPAAIIDRRKEPKDNG